MGIYGLGDFKKIVKLCLARAGRHLNKDAQEDSLRARQDLLQATHDVKAEIETLRELIRQHFARLEQIEVNAQSALLDQQAHFARLEQIEVNAQSALLDQQAHFACLEQIEVNAQSALLDQQVHFARFEQIEVNAQSALLDQQVHFARLEQIEVNAQSALLDQQVHFARLEQIEVNAQSALLDQQAHFAELYELIKDAQQERLLGKQEILQAAHEVRAELKTGYELIHQDFARLDRLDQEAPKLYKTASRATAPIENFSTSACTDAGELFLLFSELNRKAEFWNQCELLISCSATHLGALSLFPGKNIIRLEQPQDIYQAIAGRKFNIFGILSPWLISTFEAHPEILLALTQACQDRLLIVDGKNTGKDNARTRKLLHRSGFYEIAVPTSAGVFDFSTVNCAPDGRFDFAGSEPGLPSNLDEWSTHAALRLPLSHDVKQMPWRSVSLSLITSVGTSFSADPGHLALAVTRPNDGNDTTTHTDISGTVHWTEASLGHASLVSCYAGPDDTHMYASLLQTVEGIGAFISIWLNNGQWIRLAQSQIPDQLITNEQSRFSLPLWLRVDPKTVSTGSGETCLLTESNRELARTPSAGVRIAEGSISISDISYAFY